MELTPSQVSAASFRTVRKGYDPDEVNSFLQRTSKALEEAQQQATSMEARARAAVARLQELSSAAEQAAASRPGGAPDDRQDVVHVSVDEAETISRTLVLAQRTADATISDAAAEAERIRSEARAESESTLDSTREMSAQLLEEARFEARRLSDAERVAAENEVQSLVARREFLVGDVDQLEIFLEQQRERLRAAARELEAICERTPDGLGDVRPPLLSASDEAPGDDTGEHFRPPTGSRFGYGDHDEADDRADIDYDDEPTTNQPTSGMTRGGTARSTSPPPRRHDPTARRRRARRWRPPWTPPPGTTSTARRTTDRTLPARSSTTRYPVRTTASTRQSPPSFRKNGGSVRSVDPDGSSPSSLVEASGRSPWGPAIRVVPRASPVPGTHGQADRRARQIVQEHP